MLAFGWLRFPEGLSMKKQRTYTKVRKGVYEPSGFEAPREKLTEGRMQQLLRILFKQQEAIAPPKKAKAS